MKNVNHNPIKNDFSYYMSFHAGQIDEFARRTITERETDKFSSSYRDVIQQLKKEVNNYENRI